jgi:hypothetical protein
MGREDLQIKHKKEISNLTYRNYFKEHGPVLDTDEYRQRERVRATIPWYNSLARCFSFPG